MQRNSSGADDVHSHPPPRTTPKQQEQQHQDERSSKNPTARCGGSASGRRGGDPVVEALLYGVFLSRTSPLRILRRDYDSLTLIIRTHRVRNLLPFLDWTQHGCFPGLGRDNRFLGNGGRTHGEGSDDDDDGDDDDADDDDDDEDLDDDDHQGDTAEPPLLLPPPLVWGLQPADPPIARGITRCSCGGYNAPHKASWCCDFERRWDGDWWAEGREAHAARIRCESAAQWACFEKHVLRMIGRLSQREWKRAVERAKERARAKLSMRTEEDPRIEREWEQTAASERSGGSLPTSPSWLSRLAAAEQEARLHALLTEALDPELLEPFHVNMLPIEMGHYCSLPLKCRRYSGVIDLCLLHCREEVGKVGYLTIDEGWVEPDETQRRPGLHIEAHCDVLETGATDSGGGDRQSMQLKQERLWGVGVGPDILNIQGGLFQASNVSGSCRVWDCVLRDPCGVVGPHGSVEHLRSLLNLGAPAPLASLPIPGAPKNAPYYDPDNPTQQQLNVLRNNPPPTRDTPHPAAGGGSKPRSGMTIAAQELVWLTDRTPHEALPVREKVFRQFFRLVTSKVTVWYAAHSTRNDERGVVPQSDVQIVEGDKFAGPRGTGTVRRAAAEPLSFI
ncbi:hypothetical protein DFJ73DRAFT_964656 [Zopfochytrium polystomum]|nr:hypothetical protein DFJ73DRAFT_964656 [Zopfochytrium polystomum]